MADARADRPVRTVGILGGGQLGRMLALAGARLGLDAHVFCPDPASPAFAVAGRHTVAAYDDAVALAAFADAVDVVTYEFENVPAETAALLAARRPVRPGPRSLEVAQDRLAEKTFLAGLGIPTAPFRAVDDRADLDVGVALLGFPTVLKTRRFGYDGKGQAKIATAADVAPALAAMGGSPAILEGWVPFAREISILVARGRDGRIVAWDPPENEHRDHILKYSRVPARIAPTTAEAAARIGATVAEALDHVGVLAVELFVVDGPDGETLIANEIAPRVHNSGHWTESACLISQFEMHIRAVAGLPLAPPLRHSDVVMENLIGAEADDPAAILAETAASLHLYGKTESRPGRKMGHVNRLAPRRD
ncbi:5-(carboxyamino)imidazole ribonucleotide synthase [Siculibacillus lacustris]|uniref:N5-carboxyaminoimidazole ribonucleotide synthase n=1 Tax=Siculibacillus lacustris TaxID=1549641 RepID=A0A4Q9VJ59_9HYPH|nr:5-(carboxyamino)imidazole ribonucleotide synthase [Siculibacillus lacustris]TBW35087.1 5-(carboxyamino)imidazole ribonucleotide synthase [Siculibacillus lacustris]